MIPRLGLHAASTRSVRHRPLCWKSFINNLLGLFLCVLGLNLVGPQSRRQKVRLWFGHVRLQIVLFGSPLGRLGIFVPLLRRAHVLEFVEPETASLELSEMALKSHIMSLTIADRHGLIPLFFHAVSRFAHALDNAIFGDFFAVGFAFKDFDAHCHAVLIRAIEVFR